MVKRNCDPETDEFRTEDYDVGMRRSGRVCRSRCPIVKGGLKRPGQELE